MPAAHIPIGRAAALFAAVCAFVLTATPPALAQGAGDEPPVALIADEVRYSAETGVVRARGAVQVFYKGRTLTAEEVIYDSAADQVSAVGPVVLRTEGGETVYADTATLDADLREGLILGARSVIAGGGKIAAVEARREDDRYNILEKAVFSPCEVCADTPTPVWRIRAERIVHDQQEREIHYEDAYFDVFGVPIGYLPYFRHPSPEVKRASGLLAPEATRDRAYGLGVKQPYFYVIDDHSDATITPFISTSDGAILEGEYRRRFENGFIELDAFTGVTDYGGDGKGARARFGAFGTGRFTLDDGVFAGFDLAVSADDPFLRRYDYTNRDRLTSEGFLRAYDGSSFASGSVAFIQSLRAGERQGAIPVALPEISMRYATIAPGIGGDLAFTLDGAGLLREDGRDVGRMSLGAEWSRDAVTDGGLVLRGFAEARADFYAIDDDAAFDDDAARFSPRAGVEARYPLIAFGDSLIGDGGATHVVEPIIQFVVAPDLVDGDIPNEDSVLVDFDAQNLFETDRFAGFDRRETGAYVTLGARYEYFDDEGLELRASGGRILRFDDNDDFSAASGLDGDLSDYVVAGSMSYRNLLELDGRMRLGSAFGVNQAEVLGRVVYDPFTLFGAYLFVDADPAEGAPADRSEISLGGTIALDRNWTIGGDLRRDLIVDRFVSTSGVLTYEDECAGLDLYVRRELTESLSSPQGTTVGVRVRLFGAGAGDQSKASGACAYGAQ